MTHAQTDIDYVCPLASVDRRLDDVHQQWHQAEEEYFDPERFRLSIQTAIQTLRTVTFILQSNKRKIPDFDNWYAAWQKMLREDALMRWMVDARNRIEKQGDLESNSYVRAEIIASYLSEGPKIEVAAELFDDPYRLIESLPEGQVREHVGKNGILRIERRWVENSLPNYELLDAVAVAYGRISEIVHDAHTQMGLPAPTTVSSETGETYLKENRHGRLPCMIGHADPRSLNIALSIGKVVEFERKACEIQEEDVEGLIERYGDSHQGMFGPEGADEEQIARSLFNTARHVFLIDGHHETIFFLFHKRNILHIFSIRPENQGQKYLFMRNLAHEVEKYGADAVVGLSEVWFAPHDSSRPYMRAGESLEKEEALLGTMVRKNGNSLCLTAKIIRHADTTMLGETVSGTNPVLFSYAPLYEVWGKEIPLEWINTVAGLHNNRKN